MIFDIKKILILTMMILFGISKLEAATNQLAVSQGISSPTMTNTTLFSSGFTKENPVALSYQNGYRLTTSLDGSDSTSFGLDAGIGDSVYGLAIGAYSNGCDGCSSFVRGGLSAIWGSFGMGIGVQENLYTFGFLLNPNGLHRIGLVVELEDDNGTDLNGLTYNRNAFGLGYSFVLPQFTFSLDLSKENYGSSIVNGDAILLSPGVALRIDIFSVSLSYDVYMNDTTNIWSDQVWVGLGAQVTSSLHVAFYGEYVDRWTIMGSYYF